MNNNATTKPKGKGCLYTFIFLVWFILLCLVLVEDYEPITANTTAVATDTVASNKMKVAEDTTAIMPMPSNLGRTSGAGFYANSDYYYYEETHWKNGRKFKIKKRKKRKIKSVKPLKNNTESYAMSHEEEPSYSSRTYVLSPKPKTKPNSSSYRSRSYSLSSSSSKPKSSSSSSSRSYSFFSKPSKPKKAGGIFSLFSSRKKRK
ncbi:hypothetical protein SAMN05421780_11190 [Flexibacter flexilis DSM 6793]|uniref:Uncharacterized protein n=1 Tax=Flexibacter flexilis DSM 6793 TaxID=927664 RepID=A0A1I1MUA9_9BACT|nr:hypothetical protein [Flexibacter flexilis]SFC88502.1 hypothetical protein SAMN05421780_11190 [Flexibacter flexilis DSM 6793]